MVRRSSALGQSLPPVGQFNDASSHPAMVLELETQEQCVERKIQPIAVV